MSIAVMSRVWETSKQKGSALLLLLAISDFADDSGRAFPSVDTLAKKVRMTPRNVQFLLRKLEQSGELIVEPNAGPHQTHLYRVKTLQGEKFSGVKSSAGG